MIQIATYIIIIVSVLGIASLGGFIAEKSGIINFAIEGYMIFGALTYVFISQRVQGSDLNQIWIVIVAGIVSAVASQLHAIASIRFRADQVISSIAFNLLALGVALFLINTSANLSAGSSARQGYDGPLSIGESTIQWPYVFTMPLFFAIVIAILVAFGYKFTKLGYRIRSVGSNPSAAASVGIKVNMTRAIAVGLSGLIGGVAGALFSTYNTFFNGSVQGLGFLAVSIWIFGQWKPAWIILAATIFGVSFGIAERISFFPEASNFLWQPPSALLSMIPFVLSIIVLIIVSLVSKKGNAPKAIGIPYVRGQTN